MLHLGMWLRLLWAFRTEERLAVISEQIAALTHWSAEVSAMLNDFQLKENGLSPLTKHFGILLGPRFKRKQ